MSLEGQADSLPSFASPLHANWPPHLSCVTVRPMNDAVRNAYSTLLEQVRGCTLCPLSETRTNAVPGEGDADADIMFIGEAPGFHEDRHGRPFVGAAGGVLDQMLASIGLERSDVYICNMIKCRPPENRDPRESEMEACRPYLDQQIEMIDPRVIVTLGRHSFTKFFPGEAISKSRGRPRYWRGRVVFPVYHPAAILHNPRLRPALEEDFRRLPALIATEPPNEEPLSERLSVAQLDMDLDGRPSKPVVEGQPRMTEVSESAGIDGPRQGQLF